MALQIRFRLEWLALRALHPVVEDAGEQHVPQADLQLGRVEVRMPRTHRAMPVVEHAHELDGEMSDVADACIDVGPGDGTGRRGLEVTEVRLFARARVGVRNVQA